MHIYKVIPRVIILAFHCNKVNYEKSSFIMIPVEPITNFQQYFFFLVKYRNEKKYC